MVWSNAGNTTGGHCARYITDSSVSLRTHGTARRIVRIRFQKPPVVTFTIHFGLLYGLETHQPIVVRIPYRLVIQVRAPETHICRGICGLSPLNFAKICFVRSENMRKFREIVFGNLPSLVVDWNVVL